MLLIGSKASLMGGIPLGRPIGDIDVIATDLEVSAFIKKVSKTEKVSLAVPTERGKKFHAIINGFNWDFEIAWSDRTCLELLDGHLRPFAKTDLFGQSFSVADPRLIYTLKMSHRFLKNSVHFYKTMADIKKMRSHGITEIPEVLYPWYKRRVKETYYYKHPNLNVKKDEFFKDDGVQYVYDHDTIHVSMQHTDRPMYRNYMKEGSEVACDRNLFDALPMEQRLLGVAEEAYVLALERSQIPFVGKVDPAWSFRFALMKICTSITSGWFREFAWENHDEVLKLYDETYVDRFWKAVEAGVVNKIQKEEKR